MLFVILTVLALASSAVALAPLKNCSQGCPGAADGGFDCVTSCDTLLGYAAPDVPGLWLIAPALLVAAVAVVRYARRSRG